jgi:PAS domain S-box-containing protein
MAQPKTNPLPESVFAGSESGDGERLRIHQLFMHVPAAVAITRGAEHRWTFLNPAYCQAMRVRNSEEVLGRKFAETSAAMGNQGQVALLDQVFRSGEAFVGQEVEVHLSGSGDGAAKTLYFDVAYQPLRDRGGHVDGILIHATDVSDRVLARSLLQRSQEQLRILENSISRDGKETDHAARQNNEERLRAALTASQAGTFRWDPHTGEYLEFDDSLKQVFGIPKEQPVRVPEDFLKHVHPEDLPGVREGIERTRLGEDFEGEYRILMPDGSIRWIYDRAKMLFEDGKPLYLVGACMDTTTRKQADMPRLRLAAIVESSDDAIVSKSLTGIVTSWNKGAQRMFGYTPEEMIGRPITTIIPPELYSDETHILQRLQRGERIEHFETVRVHKNGELVEVSLTVSPVRDDFGRIVGAAKIARNITERKKAEQALRTSEKLASAGRMAATIAHEINNPLESIVNLLYLACCDPALTQQTRGYLTAADEELARVSHITKQTLGFYRESSAPMPTRVSELFESLLLVYGPRIRTKKINLRIDSAGEIEVPAVRGEMRQVMANILQNSLDAVESGGAVRIRIAARHRWSDGESGLEVTVADNGSGIDPVHRSRIFDPFFTTKKDFGTGLGLWVSKGIVDRHGGTIRVKSSVRPGKSWTAISIFFPLTSRISNIENAVTRHHF